VDFRLRAHTHYKPESLDKAVEAVLSGSMSQCRAAVVFGVSQPTISRHVNSRKGMHMSFLNKYKI
jgi:predicted transcriptional regulator